MRIKDEDFKWIDHKLVSSFGAIAVYYSEDSNEIVVRQSGDPLDADEVIVFPIDLANRIVNEIKDCYEEGLHNIKKDKE